MKLTSRIYIAGHNGMATGKTTYFRDFVRMAFLECGIELDFIGGNENEIGVVRKCSDKQYQLPKGQIVVKVDTKYYRPTEVDLLIGNPTKTNSKLNWKPKYDLKMLVKEMISSDLEVVKRNYYKKNYV